MIAPFDTCSFFRDSTLLHTEVTYRSHGFSAGETPFRLRHDGWSGLLLLLCLMLAASLVLRLWKTIGELVRGFFFPVPGKTDKPATYDPLRFSTRLVAVCLLSLAAAIVTFVYTQHDVGYYPFRETPYILFSAFLALWLAYFLMKRLLTNFVNWIFFKPEKIFTWQRAYTLLLSAEAMLFFLLALVAVYLPIPPEMLSIMTVALIVFVKLLLLFKTFQIFFPKMYGTLHLFVYFCTLELMPLLVMQHILTYAEYFSVIKL